MKKRRTVAESVANIGESGDRDRCLGTSVAYLDVNSSPSRRPSVKVVNQNGSVQLGEKAAEYFLGCINLRPSRQPSVIP